MIDSSIDIVSMGMSVSLLSSDLNAVNPNAVVRFQMHKKSRGEHEHI